MRDRSRITWDRPNYHADLRSSCPVPLGHGTAHFRAGINFQRTDNTGVEHSLDDGAHGGRWVVVVVVVVVDGQSRDDHRLGVDDFD